MTRLELFARLEKLTTLQLAFYMAKAETPEVARLFEWALCKHILGEPLA